MMVNGMKQFWRRFWQIVNAFKKPCEHKNKTMWIRGRLVKMDVYCLDCEEYLG